jgi:undecaprenyl-diphosphatase
VWGLSLTLSVVAILLGGRIFGEIVDSVIDRDDLAGHDSPVTGWLVAHRTGWLTAVMRVATGLGGLWFAAPLVVLAAVVLPGPWGRWRTAALMVGVTGGTSLLVNAIKVLIERPRPTLAEVVATATGYAFPSGHSAQAVAAYGSLAYLVTLRCRGRLARVSAWTGAAVIAAVVGFSRLYLGLHWLTDVLGGFLVAVVWMTAILTAVNVTTGLRARRGPAGKPGRRSAPARSGTR